MIEVVSIKKHGLSGRYCIIYNRGEGWYIYSNDDSYIYNDNLVCDERCRLYEISESERVGLLNGKLILDFLDGSSGSVEYINDPYVRECVVEFLNDDDDYYEEYEEM